jgi:hypothetical protein
MIKSILLKYNFINKRDFNLYRVLGLFEYLKYLLNRISRVKITTVNIGSAKISFRTFNMADINTIISSFSKKNIGLYVPELTSDKFSLNSIIDIGANIGTTAL